ncbi:MAG: PilN domain-containing protein, partial [Gemmatimonadales bacterium]
LILESVQPEGFKDLPHLFLRLDRPASAGWVARLPLNRLLPAVLGLWLAFGALYAVRVTVTRRSMERERTELSEAVAAVRAVRREIANTRTMVGAIEADRAANTRTLVTLAAMTEALPDSSYITSFSLDNGSGVITGHAKRASAVAASFGRSGVFIEPVIEGQVTKEIVEGTQWHRFTLTFRTRP